MARRGFLTQLAVDTAKPDPGRCIEKPDAGKPGLYLVIQTSGHKSWAVRYRHEGRPRKLTLTGFPSLVVARKLAQAALDRAAEGGDPAGEKRAARKAAQNKGPTVDKVEDAFRLFLDRHVRTRKGRPIRESSRRETARLLGFKRDRTDPESWIPSGNGVLKHWAGRRLATIGQDDVRSVLEQLALTGPVMANRTLDALKTCFTFHMRRDRKLFSESPCDGVDDPSPEGEGRDRTLDDAELTALWRVAGKQDYPYGRMVQLLILTGCRRDEVREATWAEFDMDRCEWLIPGSRTKNGRDHLVPITAAMMAILEDLPRVEDRHGKPVYLFTTTGNTPISGLSKIKKRVEKAMAKSLKRTPDRWTLHDLRRTFVTGLQRLRFPMEVAEACVNHKSGTVSGVAAVYARHDYKAEKREALEAWARHVMEAVERADGKPAGKATGKVVSFQRHRHADARV